MNKFLKGLIAALVGAGCAVLTPIASGKVFGVDYNYKTLGAAALGGAVATVIGYFRQSPITPNTSDPQTISPQAMKKFLLLVLIMLIPYSCLTPPASASNRVKPNDATLPKHSPSHTRWLQTDPGGNLLRG